MSEPFGEMENVLVYENGWNGRPMHVKWSCDVDIGEKLAEVRVS